MSSTNLKGKDQHQSNKAAANHTHQPIEGIEESKHLQAIEQ
jgi:hypothetical protein